MDPVKHMSLHHCVKCFLANTIQLTNYALEVPKHFHGH